MDNPSNLSPVTESEVMNFASRICTTIVAHSQQQGRIESLERSLNETTSERDHLRSENSKLNQDIGETTSLADGYSRERDDAVRRLQEAEGKLRYQEEMAIQRDAKVAEVQGLLNDVQGKYNAATKAASDFENKVHDYRDQLDRVTADRDHWRQAADKAHSDAIEATTKLEKIPFAIRSHFTGEAEQKPETEQPKPVPEMKPVVQEDDKEEYRYEDHRYT